MITDKQCSLIDRLALRGHRFALWRRPGDTEVHFMMQTGGDTALPERIEALNGCRGFVFAPFQIAPQHPIVLIRPDIDNLDEAERLPDHNDEATACPAPPLTNSNEARAEYARRFARFMEPLQRGIQDKLVLSRREVRPAGDAFSPAGAFRRAALRYTRSYVYLAHTPETGTWIGATPEILLAGSAGQWQTVALAGTLPVGSGGGIPQRWDDKNWREQQLVACYIRRQLTTLGIRAEEMGPYAVRAGEVSHLKSEFRFRLPDGIRPGDLLARLHPTPAVCGLPEEEAFRFILDNEGYDRSYYSGFIGTLDCNGETALYVNLRCMQICPPVCTLYAGGGLLASSDLASEWRETCDKMETMGRLLP